jgi:hypothetical protein
MSKIQYYKLVTPTSNFIQIYLQLTDLMVIEKRELSQAVTVLLKVVNVLSQYEIEQYSVYLALMKTYLKVGELNNFIKTLENCRLFLSKMFGERALIFDFPFIRILIILAISQDPNKGLEMANTLIAMLVENKTITE